MPITQVLLTATAAGGGGGGGGGIVDTGITLSGNWTIEIVTTLEPTGFWASLWANEVYDSGLGYLAYLTSTVDLNVGVPNGTDAYTLTDDIAIKAHWAFVHTTGSISVYRNGVLLTPSFSGFSEPAGTAYNTLLLGSRHNNDGTGSTDLCPGSYDWYNITQGTALDALAIQSSYASLQGTYGI